MIFQCWSFLAIRESSFHIRSYRWTNKWNCLPADNHLLQAALIECLFVCIMLKKDIARHTKLVGWQAAAKAVKTWEVWISCCILLYISFIVSFKNSAISLIYENDLRRKQFKLRKKSNNGLVLPVQILKGLEFQQNSK